MEFALEGRRYEDIIRWKLAEKVLNKYMYGMLDPAPLRTKVVISGLWFFPQTPDIDEDGCASFEPINLYFYMFIIVLIQPRSYRDWIIVKLIICNILLLEHCDARAFFYYHLLSQMAPDPAFSR